MAHLAEHSWNFSQTGTANGLLPGDYPMMKQLSEDLWQVVYPLKLLGADLRRNVTIIRLDSGQLVIHSTGPFQHSEVASIISHGEPGWIAEAMLSHDTYSREGRLAFPRIPFLAPEGFSERVDFPVTPLLPPPEPWRGELEVLLLEGNDAYREHVFFHRKSRTLIVADLAFNFSEGKPPGPSILLQVAVSGSPYPGMSQPFKISITNEPAFRSSVARMMAWDFDRVIVGHGDLIETGGKPRMEAMLQFAGF